MAQQLNAGAGSFRHILTKILILSALGLSAQWIQASSTIGACEPALTSDKIFEQHFHSEICYTPGKCHINIAIFIRRLEGKHIDLTNSKVLILPHFRMNKVRSDHLSALRNTVHLNNSDIRATWNFHVVFYLDGLIHDFDYSNHPTPMPIKMYMSLALDSFAEKKVYGDERLRPDDRIFVVDTRDYLKNNTEIENWLGELSANPDISNIPSYIHKEILGEISDSRK